MNGLFLVETMNSLHHLSTKPRNICKGLSIFGIAHIISLQVGWDTVKHNASCRKEWEIHIGFHHNKFGPICMNDIYVLNFNYSAHAHILTIQCVIIVASFFFLSLSLNRLFKLSTLGRIQGNYNVGNIIFHF